MPRGRPYTGEPCPHMPHIYNTEAAHLAHNRRNKEWWERKQWDRGVRQFDSDSYPLRLKLQRLLAAIKQRCRTREQYAGRGIQCRVTFDDLLFAWNRDDAESLQRPSIDRKDNDGDYEPSNIRFIELAENIRRGVEYRESKRRWRRKPSEAQEIA